MKRLLFAGLAALLLITWGFAHSEAFREETPGVLAHESALPTATYTVNTTADTDDGTCSTSAGGCTLREAINAANGTSGATIQFALGAGTPTIHVGSGGKGALPTLSRPMTIDGNTGGSQRVEIDGTSAGAYTSGLILTGGNTTIKYLVINRFPNNGIWVLTNGGNTFLGNIIGANASGSAALANGAVGIRLDNVPSNHVGGTNGTNPGSSCTGDCNLISGNGDKGVLITGANARSNTVQGNFIGTNINGTAAIRNMVGVGIDQNASNNTIGGTSSAARNLISGHENANYVGVGVLIGNGATQNTVIGNFIGTNAAGTAGIGNAAGIQVASPSNIIGGTTGTTPGGACAGACNLISANHFGGVQVFTSASAGTQILGNFIGTNASGTGAVPNDEDGIYLENAPSLVIGGYTPQARNLISGNGTIGIEFLGSGSTNVQVLGNYIGTTTGGEARLANNGGGIFVGASPGNLLGNNLISGNNATGIQLQPGGDRTSVQSNWIGVAADGVTALGNRGHGIQIQSSGNSIGTPASPNIIANSSNMGIVINPGTGNAIRGNSIYNSQGGLGLDLGGDYITFNDAADPDVGSNLRQNFPVLSIVTGDTTVTGSLNSLPNTSFTLDFFSSPACDPSGYGEGKTYLGSTTVRTDGSGNASFSVALGAATNEGSMASATATDPSGNTSEFSACALVQAPRVRNYRTGIPFILRSSAP